MDLKQETLDRLNNFVNSDKFSRLRPETQERLQSIIQRQSEPGATGSFVESKEPVFGAEQIIPESPVGAFGRARLGFARPEEREPLLKKQFGEVFGKPGREVVPARKGFQAVSPKGFDVGDIPEFAGKATRFALDVAPQAIGGAVGFSFGGIPGAAVGAGITTAAVSDIKKNIGRALGTRPDDKVTQDTVDSLIEGASAGLWELGGRGAIKAIPGTGKLFQKLGAGVEKLVQSIGKVSDMSSSWMKQRVLEGAKKTVFNPEKTSAEYAGKVLVPRFKEGINNSLRNYTNNTKQILSKFGVSDESINFLRKKGYDSIKVIQQNFKNSTSEISNKLQSFLVRNLDDAGKQFDDVLRNQPEGTRVSSNHFINSTRKVLKNTGLMNSDGSFRATDPKLVPRELRNLITIYNEVLEGTVTPGKFRPTGTLPIEDYFRYKTVLDNSIKGNTQMDVFLIQARNGLRNDAINSIKGLKGANKIYSEAKQLHDDFVSENKTGEKTLDNFRKMTEKRKKELSVLDKKIKFIDDLDSIHTARELDDVMEKQFSDNKIFAKMTQGAREQNVIARNSLKEVDDLLPKESKIYSDYRDWLAHMDMQDVNLYLSEAGKARFFSQAAVPLFYKEIFPKTAKMASTIRGMAKIGEKVVEPQFGQFRFSPLSIGARKFSQFEEE